METIDRTPAILEEQPANAELMLKKYDHIFQF